MSPKKILVVGGCGFIGSEVNKLLHQAGYETVILDNLSDSSKRSVKWGTFIKGDLGNRRLLEKLFSTHHFDAVMHFAAYIDVGESVRNPRKYYDNNVSKTLTLLNAMCDHDVKIFIFSSTAAVYGLPTQPLLSEDHPKNPINPYGQTKLIIEKILEDFDIAYGLKSAKMRYFNAAGGDPDGQIKLFSHKKTNLIPLILDAVRKKQPITIHGTDYPTPDGTCVRDYVHIYDLGIAHIKAMEKLFEGGKSEAYNLGNGKGFSVREVIRATEKVLQTSIQVIEGPRRPGDPPFLLADTTKAQKLLNWQVQYPDIEMMLLHQTRATRPGPRQKIADPLHT